MKVGEELSQKVASSGSFHVEHEPAVAVAVTDNVRPHPSRLSKVSTGKVKWKEGEKTERNMTAGMVVASRQLETLAQEQH